MKEFHTEAKIDKLDEVIGFIDAELETHDCPMKVQMQIDVAVEELFVNICHYAYSPDVGEAVIGIEIAEDPARAEITFKDSGVPYDPTAKEDPDVSLSAEEREVGGLGIYMVKKSMDKMVYSYDNGFNNLRIIKKF